VLGRDPRRVDVVYAAMDAAVKGHAYAKSAVDIACWDLLGKATGMRVADLLGGAFQEEIPLYTGIGIAPPEEMRRRAEDAVAAGYRHVQLKVGTAWQEDVTRVEACLGVLGGAERVIVDANGYWPQAEAVRAVAALANAAVAIEQPCVTIDECREVRRRSRLPFVLDESLTDMAALERARGAADAVRLKLSQFGGITPIRRARDFAAAWGLQMTLEDSGGGDVVTAAMAHLSASVPPRLLLAGFLVGEMVRERIAAGAPRAQRGTARLPDGPGLGVEVDEAALGDAVLRFE
jgi:L-alanine-DL-glutamate epimerase-like enolase superfamily enzyme